MPGWYDTYKGNEDLQIVGLIQEQHPERCRLFMTWKQMGFPILVDALNRIGVYAVPLMWAIDEHGVVQKTRPREDWINDEFLTTNFPAPKAEPKVEIQSPGVKAFLTGDAQAAVAAFEKEVAANDASADSWFRLGCSLRARHDSEYREPGDFQGAITAWTKALELNPPNYIFNRRLQQYGPRLMKPYPFYTWVQEAQEAIAARGDEVPPLTVALEGSELALPDRQGVQASEVAAIEPDPTNALPRDAMGLVKFESVVAPTPATAGQNARIYLRFVPDNGQGVTWDNEAGELRVWLKTPDGLVLAEQLLVGEIPPKSSSNEIRSLEFEAAISDASRGKTAIEGYALYYVCSGESDECVYLRQDFSLSMDVTAPKQRRRRR